MLTTRGWLFVLTVVPLLALAMLLPIVDVLPPFGHQPLILVGFTLLGWFLVEWFLFAVRARTVLRQLTIQRDLRDERGEVVNLWAGRTFQVRVRIACPTWPGLPHLLLTDRVPFGVEQTGGEPGGPCYEGALTPAQPAELVYRIRCPAAGQVRFEGVRVQMTDLQGFFYHRTFLADGTIARVLPVLSAVESRLPITKRFNLLPPPGVHRHRRPGTGSELLDLRDYMPGDPPRMIAWKVSARRDRLITKELESDVPVRCTLFVDTSNSVRLGPPGQNALARLVEIAAAVAQASAGNRDPVGLALCDEREVNYLRPARTRRHLTDVLNLLADAVGKPPTTGEAPIEQLLPLGYSFAQEVYPDLMRPHVNHFPAWLPWLKPRSLWTVPRPTLGDFFYWILPLIVLVSSLGIVYLLVRLWIELAWWLRDYGQGLSHFLGAGMLAVTGIMMVFLFFRVLRMFFPQRRREYRWRKLLSALLSHRHGLAPGGVATLLEDDRLFALHLQRFLAEHHVPTPLQLYDEQGRYLFASPGKVDVLANALLRAVGKGHDNELFVLLVDLLELNDHLAPLLRAVKVTLARHHQVIVVCPWPPGMLPPGSEEDPQLAARRATQDQPRARLVAEATTKRFHEAFATVRRTFARLGVSVVCAQDKHPARLIVDRIDRLRTVRSGPRR
jgi:uncharacterized protein (DUF58 family)